MEGPCISAPAEGPPSVIEIEMKMKLNLVNESHLTLTLKQHIISEILLDNGRL